MNFWKSFAKNYWEKKSLVVKDFKSNVSEIDAAQVFDLLVAAVDQSRRTKTLLGFKFFVNGLRSSDVEAMHVLPRKSDRTLQGYNERMERVYQDYCLVCDELMQVNHDKQHLLNQFTRKLYEQVGFPNRFAEMGLYLGNYRKTPFGVHVDKCGVFSFPVVGTKKFRVWSSAYVKKHPELEQSFRYAKHKSHSQLLEVRPGEMSYWPSSAWHIAESNGKFTATWSLGVWVDKPTHETVTEVLAKLVHQALGASAQTISLKVQNFHSKDGSVAELPQLLAEALNAAKNLSPDDLKNAFVKNWLKHLSSHGMKTLPRSKTKAKLPAKISLRHPDSPILWRALDKNSFVFTFGGLDTQESTSKGLLRLIRHLNEGKTCRIQDYLKGQSRASDLRALSALAQANAFS